MTRNRNQIGAVALALLAILAIAAGGVTADTFDTETTESSTQSDVSGTTTTVDLRPGNSSEALYVEINASSADAAGNRTLILKPEDANGEVIGYSAYKNTSGGDAVAGTLRNVKWNISHDELADIPRDVDGGTYRLEIWNTTSDAETLNTTVEFAHKGANRTAVVHLADTTSPLTPLLADDVEISEKFGWFGAERFWRDNGTTVSEWSAYTAVNGTNTSVEVHAVNSSTATALDDASERYEDGDWIRMSTLWVNGIPVKVYKNEAPEDVQTESPYAVWHTNSDELEIVTQGDAFTTVRTIQLRGTAGEGYNFGTILSEFGVIDAGQSLVPT